MERRELFSLFYTAARAATVWAALPSGSGSSVVHLGVYEHESGPLVEVLTTITGGYRRLDDSTPSYELLPLALGHLHHVSNVLQRSSSEAGRKKLLAVASEASGLVGGLAFDSGNHLQASHHYHAAITLAERAGNTLLQVFSLGMMSYFKAETGHGAVAVELVERGKSLLPADDPPTIQGRMATYEANAYSRIGDVPRALSALNRADTASGQIQADQEMFWPLVFPFDMKRLARERGACATRLKRPEIALPALEEGIKALGSALVSKRRALLLLDLAECYTLAGEAEEACRLTAEAFAIGVQMGSDRALKRVGEVRKELTPWKGTQAVRELDEQLLEGLLGD